MYIKTLTQNDLIETDNGPSYQYCEGWADEEEADGCPGNMFAGDQVVRTTEEADGMNAIYCTVCYMMKSFHEWWETMSDDLLWAHSQRTVPPELHAAIVKAKDQEEL